MPFLCKRRYNSYVTSITIVQLFNKTPCVGGNDTDGLWAEVGLTHLPWTIWPPFRTRHFQMHFLECNVLYFNSMFTEVCS